MIKGNNMKAILHLYAFFELADEAHENNACCKAKEWLDQNYTDYELIDLA